MDLLAFVPDDGYTESAFVREEPGIYPAVRFTFRPMNTVEVTRNSANYSQDARNPEAGDKKCAASLAAKLIEWDLSDGKGGVLKISETNLLRLKPRLFTRIWGIVSGNFAADAEPDAAATPTKSDPEGDAGN